MERPLEGILVVALEQAVAAPFCTSRLADAGARVIKIERAAGDFARDYDSIAHGESAFFVWLNRGKESLTLDIKAPDDLALLKRILAQADVFVQNLAPGGAARAGVGSDDLREQFPSLITCDISGYGETGPYSDMKAYDMLVQAETGLASITGTPDAPGRVGVSICDIASGMYAWASILEALYERKLTGVGKGLKVSMFDALSDWMTVPLLYQELAGRGPQRIGMHHVMISPYGTYRTGDGNDVVIGIQNQREWQRFCEQVLLQPTVSDDARFATNADRVANRGALDEVIGEVFGSLSREDIATRLRAAQIAFGALNSVEDLSKHPQLRRVDVGTPSGPVSVVAPPVQQSGQSRSFGPMPALGEHSKDIRKEFG
ncbi:MAG: CoA transferase [Gammaproteobacteria bacterium]|nr:CoA transferase [Gammaproteobacteria bacterium]